MTGWYKFYVKGAGAGGNAGGADSGTVGNGGAGGSEGGLTIEFVYINKKDIVSISIGKGGLGGQFNKALGSAGENTIVLLGNKEIIGYGGSEGTYGRSTHIGGLGGKGTLPGMAGSAPAAAYAGGHDGRSGAGNGGGISYKHPDGIMGGGGAGGWANYLGSWNKGGNGGDGVVWIEYFDPNKK